MNAKNSKILGTKPDDIIHFNYQMVEIIDNNCPANNEMELEHIVSEKSCWETSS